VGEVRRVEAVRDDGDAVGWTGRVLLEELLAGGLVHHDHMVGLLEDRALPALLARAARRVAGVPLVAVEPRRPRVPQVGDPGEPGAATQREREHVQRLRGSGRVDRGDAVPTRDREAAQERSRQPDDLRVGHEQSPPDEVLQPRQSPAARQSRLALADDRRTHRGRLRRGSRGRRGARTGDTLRGPGMSLPALAPARSAQHPAQASAESRDPGLDGLDLDRRRRVDGHAGRNLLAEAGIPQVGERVRHRVDDRVPAEPREVLDELEGALNPASPLRGPAEREHEDRSSRRRDRRRAHASRPVEGAAPVFGFCAS